MSAGGSAVNQNSKSAFWKRGSNIPGSSKPVYGAQHPPIQEKIVSSHNNNKKEEKMRNTRGDSFQDFQAKTSDAWDDADDDLMIDMANIKMSMRDIQSTARAVIDHHSRQAKTGSVSYSGSSAPQGSHKAGPGVGVRLNNTWQPPKTTAIRYNQDTTVDREVAKLEKIKTLLAGPTNLVELQKLSWSGLPRSVRPTCWKILSGYLPASLDRRQPTLQRKRQEYFSLIAQYYDSRHEEQHQDTFRQIHIDIPRMNPLIPIFQQLLVQRILKDVPRMTSLAHLFQQKRIQEGFPQGVYAGRLRHAFPPGGLIATGLNFADQSYSLLRPTIQMIFERILYIWAIRHPASGYVQGINDLVTPFFIVFLSEYISNDVEAENIDLTELPEETLHVIEADTFWCTSKLLDGIQDNYTFAQPGIQTKVNALRELVKRIDSNLHSHLEEHQVEYLQFAFRWMNNLLMREVPLRCSIRLWDTFLSETNGFADFHLYVCAAFLTRFSKDLLREKDFQGILMYLQSLPTHQWHDAEIGELLAEAFKLKYMFADAPNHLSTKKS